MGGVSTLALGCLNGLAQDNEAEVVSELMISPISEAIVGSLPTSVTYGGQIPRRTLAFRRIWVYAAPTAGNLLASSGPFADTGGVR